MRIREIQKIAKYVVVGLTSNGLGLGLYGLLTLGGLAPELSAASTYIIAASVSYIGNYKWTFLATGGHLKTLARFTCAHALGFTVQIATLILLYRVAHLPHILSQAAAMAIAALCLYGLSRFFVYSIKG